LYFDKGKVPYFYFEQAWMRSPTSQDICSWQTEPCDWTCYRQIWFGWSKVELCRGSPWLPDYGPNTPYFCSWCSTVSLGRDIFLLHPSVPGTGKGVAGHRRPVCSWSLHSPFLRGIMWSRVMCSSSTQATQPPCPSHFRLSLLQLP
jgi:hypothetical protein